jgi:hypothetical protein
VSEEAVGSFVVCSFASTDEIKGLQGTRRLHGAAADRVYAALKATVLAVGRFSVLEATQSTRAANLFTRLHDDVELETVDLPYPWVGIRRRT